MRFKKQYKCGECFNLYNIKQIEEYGIFRFLGNTFWICPNCQTSNLFFNNEMKYMPGIIEV